MIEPLATGNRGAGNRLPAVGTPILGQAYPLHAVVIDFDEGIVCWRLIACEVLPWKQGVLRGGVGCLRCFREKPVVADDTVKAVLARSGGVTRLIVPGDSNGERSVQPNAVLIKAVSRAHVWHERLLTGKAASIQAIAREEGVTEGYVGRLLPLTFLAPELVDTILQGRQPPELTIELALKNLSLNWAKQREALG